MRRTAALVVALPIVMIVAGALTGSPEPDAAPDGPFVASAPVPPAALSPTATEGYAHADRTLGVEDAEIDADGTHVGSEGAPDAEGTVDTSGRSAVQPAAPDDAGGDDVASVARGPVEDTFLIARVPDAMAVLGSGPRWRYTIEVEPGLGVDVEELAVEVRAALTDDRSWVRTRTLEQVDDPGRARIRVVLASPDTVDELCGRVGLRTAGIFSCWNGRFAALNSWRWEVGADAFDDITTYRNYLVNHEFGHGLGYGHVGCPAEGAPAPVMMQQSKGVGACVANGWPYP